MYEHVLGLPGARVGLSCAPLHAPVALDGCTPLLCLPRAHRDIYGRRSEIVLRSLWQTLLMNILYGLSNPRIDNWCGAAGCACCGLHGAHGLVRPCRSGPWRLRASLADLASLPPSALLPQHACSSTIASLF